MNTIMTSTPRKVNPFPVIVIRRNEGTVKALGPGLRLGEVGKTAEFTLVTHNSGNGDLSLVIEGPSDTTIRCEDMENGTIKVKYVPRELGAYRIIIKFKGNEIAGSPFIPNITVPDNNTNNQATPVLTPSDIFVPREMGVHYGSVPNRDEYIPDSLTAAILDRSQNAGNQLLCDRHDNIGIVTGPGLQEGFVNYDNTFSVYTLTSVAGNLFVAVDGPSKAELWFNQPPSRSEGCEVFYRVNQPGNYLLTVKFSGEHIPGSPYNLPITMRDANEDATRNSLVNELTVTGLGLYEGIVNCDNIFSVYINDPITGDLTFGLDGPGTPELWYNTLPGRDDACEVFYRVDEPGDYLLNIRFKGQHISKSPYKIPVIQPNSDAVVSRNRLFNEVAVTGSALYKGLLNYDNIFSVFIREPITGNLVFIMDGPKKPELQFNQLPGRDDACEMSYRVDEPGIYELSIKFNGEHILCSPYSIRVFQTDTDEVALRNRPDNEGLMQQTTTQLVQFASGDQELDAAENVDNLDNHQITFTSRRDVGISPMPLDSQVESPRELNEQAPLQHNTNTETGQEVEGNGDRRRANPRMLFVIGEGLVSGCVGKETHFFVNTSNAGVGDIKIDIDGPGNVVMTYLKVDNGFGLTYVPYAAGEYKINITFVENSEKLFSSLYTLTVEDSETEDEQQSNVDIEEVESPIISEVEEIMGQDGGPSRPDLVVCEGEGLERALLGENNTVYINASQAGTDMLLVGVCGPNRPNEAVSINHIGDQRYKIDYVARERGRHMLMIKWGDNHVPGSPFIVNVD